VSLVWQIALTFIGFLSTMYFAHAVGADVLGAYFLFVSYYGIFYLLADGGFGGAAIKRISEGEEQDSYFSAFFVLHFIFITAIIIALITFQNYFVDLNDAGMFVWLILALIMSLLYRTVQNGIAGCGKIGICSTFDFLFNTFKVLIQVIAVFWGYGAAGLAGGFVIGLFVAFILELHFLDLHFVRFGWKHIKSLSIFSFWLFLTSSGMIVYSNIDSIMIGYFLHNTDVGIYRVVMQFTLIATFATNALRSTLWPKVSRWGKIGDFDSIDKSFSSAINYSLLLAIPVFVGGVLLGDRLLYFFYGAVFEKGYMTLVVLLIVQIVNVFQFLFTAYLGALDHQKDAFKVTAVATIVNVILNLVLIPVIGISGAAIATLITIGLNAILARRVLYSIMNVRFEYNSLLNILKASFVMGLFIGAYRIFIPLSNVWVTSASIVLSAAVYGIFVLVFDKKIYEELKGIMVQMNDASHV